MTRTITSIVCMIIGILLVFWASTVSSDFQDQQIAMANEDMERESKIYAKLIAMSHGQSRLRHQQRWEERKQFLT